MARKYDLISELYNRTCKTVVSNPQNWQAFLASACRNYKLRYDEQLLVYAQRPDATAVLEIEQWNKIFGRWVNRGARGIAVFADENRSRQRLTHYFDISDTHESRYSRTVPIWDMRQEYEADVIETLESTFGEIENKSSLAEAIMGAARNAAEDNIPDYLQDLYYATEGSSFEEVEEDIVAFIYKNVVTNSVAYMMMSRLGVDTDGYFELDDFRDVTNFNTQETLNALGFATSDIAEMGLTEISKTITALNRQNRIIVGQDRNEYNKVENNDERSLDNERTDLHDGGRLQPYLDEITGGRGTVFATGTPISNSMVELYTIQRYLQYNTLVKNGLQHFDAWASTFGETIIALHDVDCPWRPSDLEQRSGRIVRQGNENPQVDIYRYVTEQTFDAYLYQLVEGKQKFASQIMTSKSPVRSAEDIDETALSYAEIKMLATGNPYIKEKMDLDIQVQKLKMLKSNFLSEKYGLEDKVIKFYPQQIAYLKSRVEGLTKDVETAKLHPKPIDEQPLGMMVSGVSYSEKAEAGQAIINACKSMNSPDAIPLGEYRGFQMELYFDTVQRNYVVKLKGETSRDIPLGDDAHGNIVRIDNGIERFEETLADTKNSLENTEKQFETAKQEIEKPFAKEEELRAKTARLDELNILLNMDKKENEIVGGEPDEGEMIEKKSRNFER